MVEHIVVTISRDEGVFQLTCERRPTAWGFSMRATTRDGKTIQAGDDLLHAHRREIVAMFESSGYVLETYGHNL